MNRGHIPRDWTAEQAFAVAEFLQEILDDIWDVHGREINEIRHARFRHVTQLHLDLADKDLPF